MDIVNNKEIGQQNINSTVVNNFGVSELKKDLQRQLREAENYIDNYKPQTAFNELLQIEKAIEDAEITTQQKNELIAKCYYLKAIAMIYCVQNSENEVNKYFFKSYQLCHDEIKYAERACTTHYKLGNDAESINLANHILAKDSTSVRANIIKKFLDKDFTIPKYIEETPEFKERYINLLSVREKVNYPKITHLFEKEFAERYLPKTDEINGYKLYYWLFVSTVINEKVITPLFINCKPKVSYIENNSEIKLIVSGEIPDYDKGLLEYANKLQAILLNRVQNTEIQNTLVVNNLYYDYYLALYILTQNKEHILELSFRYKYFADKYTKIKRREIIDLLLQIEEYQRAIDFANQDTTPDDTLYFLLSGAYHKLNQKEQAIVHLYKFLDAFSDEITLTDIWYFTTIIDAFKYFEEPTTKLDEYYIENYIYHLPEYKLFLQAYLHSWDKSKEDSTKQKLDSIKANDDLMKSFRAMVLIAYTRIGDYGSLKSIFEKSFDRNNEFETHFYIVTLYNLKENHILLLELLKLQRERNASNHFFIDIELDLCILVKDAKNVEQVALYAIENFTGDKYKLQLIQALHFQGNRELDIVMYIQKWQDGFLNYNISWETKFSLGHICLVYKQYDIALTLLYGALKENYDFHKKRYLDLMLLWDNTEWAKQFRDLEKVEKDTFVQVIISVNNEEIEVGDEDRIKLFEINETNLKTNNIVKAIFGKSKNDVIEIPNNGFLLNTPKKTITIKNIAHKYVGVLWKIFKEFDNPEENGIRGVAFSLPKTADNFIAGVNEFFIKNFGLEGDLQNIKIKENTALYYQRRIGFTELLRKIGNSQRVLETYDFLTSNAGEGFVVLPLSDYNHIQIEQNTKFVADFTTILLLRTISETYPVLPPQKIVISQHLITYLNNQIFEEENNLEVKMSMNVNSAGVMPYFHRKEDKIQKIDSIKNLVNWLLANCEIKVSSLILDYYRNQDELEYEEIDLYKDYLLDTMLLANENNVILLSEDTIFSTLVNKNFICSISLEYFLQQTQPEIFAEKLLPYLIEHNYLGITINAKSMIQELEKNKGKILINGQKNSFNNCINMLSFNHNYYEGIAEEVIKFLKYLYCDGSLPIQYRQNISQKILSSFLKHIPNKYGIIQLLNSLIETYFNLLGEHKDNVISDIDFAMDIIRRS